MNSSSYQSTRRTLLGLLAFVGLLAVAGFFEIAGFGPSTAAHGAEPAEAAASPPPAANRDQDLQFFETRVRPLLIQRCYECHGPDAQEGELRLDHFAGIMQGGASGAVLVPGKPEESLLLAAVSYRNEELRMPPDAKLTDAEIAVLTEWTVRGAPHPEAAGAAPVPQSKIDLEQGRQFWAFQPPAAVEPPAVNDAAWIHHPLDQFLLAKLEANGLRPAPPADRRTWIRRVTFSLTGLPPTVEEVDAFLADPRPDAKDRVVDRLLSSPRYGERWGRHWLDVARYADSNGLDENVAHGNAWRYRDYVISAFNQDKPFDQFTREQLAGDLLPAADESQRHEQLIATGFLGLGPKVLAEVDEGKMEMDIVDEQLDTFGRAFLALTLGCARCHDHKFDPIRTDDYYALAGILQSTRTMESFQKVAKWYENSLATPAELAAKAEHERQVADKKAAIAAAVEAAKEKLAAALGPGASLPADPEPQFPAETKAELKRQRDELKELEKSPPPISSAMGATEGTPIDAAICLRGSHLTRGRVVPRGVPAVMPAKSWSVRPEASGRLELANWLTDRDHPLLARVLVNRVWRWHFGRGIVGSPDNFGLLGDRPTHPELLDWLAVWFIDHDFSMKALHRLIVTSAVYGQAGQPRAMAAGSPDPRGIDPENRWLWHFPVLRLEAEAVRDAVLAVSGQLDSKMGGSLLHVGNREYLFDHTSKDLTKYDSRRRTVYLPVVRNNLYDVCQLLDATDATVPSGDRTTSTVATQALLMMNSPLVLDAARALAESSVSAAADPRSRVSWLIERTLGRPATDAELARAVSFVSQHPKRDGNGVAAELQPWMAFAHVLLASNEFMYLR